MPIIGYLRLRGKCRACGSKFSARYMWIEIATGLLFLALYFVEIVLQSTGGPEFIAAWHKTPGLKHPYGMPTLHCWLHFATHAFLLAALLAASVIDFQHRIIPAQITYVGTVVGIVTSTFFAWPWPSTDPFFLARIPTQGIWPPGIYTGLTLWPFWGPLPEWCPPGSLQLGFLNGLIGAAVGMAIGRGIKMIFELGFGNEALGLGDADLLMMAGSFLGWQAIALALPIGAVLTLALLIPNIIWKIIRGKRPDPQLAFGPGIAAGIVACWFGWPWLGEVVQGVFFQPFILGFMVLFIGGGMLIAGLFLRRKKKE